ncbi:MAG: chalcone isomerase family protein [Pelovirga sp.]
MNGRSAVLLLGILLVLAAAPATADPFADPFAGLELVGAGEVRYMGVIRVYRAELLAPAAARTEDILAATSSFCLRLHYRVALAADDFIKAADTILARQHTQQTLARVAPLITRLHQSYRDVKKGDHYGLCYHAATRSTALILNDEVLVTIDSAEFARIYSGIWLGEQQPLSTELRRQLLDNTPKQGD